jgi:hypothetical protein
MDRVRIQVRIQVRAGENRLLREVTREKTG